MRVQAIDYDRATDLISPRGQPYYVPDQAIAVEESVTGWPGFSHRVVIYDDDHPNGYDALGDLVSEESSL